MSTMLTIHYLRDLLIIIPVLALLLQYLLLDTCHMLTSYSHCSAKHLPMLTLDSNGTEA